MWSLIIGFPLPFILLALTALGSYVCSKFIENDEQTCFNNCNINSDVNFAKTSHEFSYTQKHISAFLGANKNFFDNLFTKKQVSSHNNARFDQCDVQISKEYRHPNHYTCPPTSLEALRRRFGTAGFWGDWSPHETRLFYKQQLPRALQIDGALGLSLEQRAEIASANRHALRLYARERCHLPARIIARVYDGLRHLYVFGSWNSDGMTWEEVKQKYALEARKLGCESEEDILLYVYKRIVDRSASTNHIFDDIARQTTKGDMDSNQMFFLLLKSILESQKISAANTSIPSRNSCSRGAESTDNLSSSYFGTGNFKITKLKSLKCMVPKLFSI